MRTLTQYWEPYLRSTEFWEKIILGIFVLSIFINVPIYANETYAYMLGEKKDFLIMFLWLSDLTLLLVLGFSLWHQNTETKKTEPTTKWLLWMLPALAGLQVITTVGNWNNILLPPICIYYLLLLYKGFVLHGTGVLRKHSLRKIVENSFIVAATAEALLAIYQFSQQHSLGMKYLGETILGPSMVGIAKIEAETILFMRAYGTLPHPNVLGAMLAIAILILINRLVPHATNVARPKQAVGLLQVGLILIALILTFSRAAWVSLALGAVYYLYTHLKVYVAYKKEVFLIFAYLSIAGAVSLIILNPLVQPRTNVLDKAYSERSSYNRVGIDYVGSFPLTGTGPGQSLLHMKHSLGTNAQPWEVQPIHNYYL
nr:O-antigen ligase family protein [Candidatus Doudnabacteria bacterium]